MMNRRIFENILYIIENERPLKTVVIRPDACGDDEHGDELTQFQQSRILPEIVMLDQPRAVS